VIPVPLWFHADSPRQDITSVLLGVNCSSAEPVAYRHPPSRKQLRTVSDLHQTHRCCLHFAGFSIQREPTSSKPIEHFKICQTRRPVHRISREKNRCRT